MNQQEPMQEHDQELLDKIEALLAHELSGRPVRGSVEELAARLVNTVPQANPKFMQQLEARLMTQTPSLHQNGRQLSAMAGENHENNLSRFQRSKRLGLLRYLWMPTAALLVIALLGWAFLANPSLRTAAAEILGLFDRQPTDMINEKELGDEALYAETVFFDLATVTRAEIEETTGFPMRMPKSLPANYYLQVALYNPAEQMITLAFRHVDRPDIESIVLLQQPAASVDATEFFKVGASTTVEEVQVGALPAEYVIGAWCRDNNGDELVWCDFLEDIRNLRWYQDDFALSLLAYGEPEISDSPSRTELVEIGAHLTLDYELSDYVESK